MSCIASPLVFNISEDGNPACSLLFLALWLRPRAPQFMTLSSRSSDSFLRCSMEDDKDELLLCLIIALRKYSLHTQQYHFEISNLFISVTNSKKEVSQNTISWWFRSVISRTCGFASEEYCRLVRVKAYEVRKTATSLLFWRNFAIQQVLMAGTWLSQSTFSVFCLRNVSRRHMNTCSIRPVLAAQEVVYLTSSFGLRLVTFNPVVVWWSLMCIPLGPVLCPVCDKYCSYVLDQESYRSLTPRSH